MKLARWLLIGTACCIALAYFCWPSSHWIARRQLRADLLTTSRTDAEQLARLERFVRIGDHINDVQDRLPPVPSIEPNGLNRLAFRAYQLDGVNPELAIESDGRVVGIGRYIWNQDNKNHWYAPPQWYHCISQAEEN